ncbi:MAG: alpha-galactosidase [Bacteroidales bacterium]|nr:alpha-galactosidase [Bacteroidales bacterium]
MKKHLSIALVCASLFLMCSCASNNEQAPDFDPPIMGWSSWNYFKTNISEEVICGQADALISTGLAAAGYVYVNIDDGFTDGRGEDGRIRIDTTKFPNGMKAVADYIHSKGLKAGMYSDAGDNTCASLNVKPYGLNVGLYGHEVEDCKMMFDEWGYDFFKVDNCGGRHLDLNEQEQFTKIAEALAQCENKNINFNVCRWVFPGTWVIDIADSWRTTHDIWVNWDAVKTIIKENMYLVAYTGNGHYNDMDMLEIGQGFPPEIERTHMACWSIQSSPLVVGCNLYEMPEYSIEFLKNADLIAMNQDRLGIAAPVVQKAGEVYVFAKDMEKFYGPKRAVVVSNLGDEQASINVDVAALGFKGDVKVYDCFKHEDRPELSGNFTLTIPAHDSEAFFVTGKRAEKSEYQAEEAFLNAYTEINEQDYEAYRRPYDIPSPHFRESDSAFMGFYATDLGGWEENWLEWRNVYSEKGGDYVLSLRFCCPDERDITLSVNGEEVYKFDNIVCGLDIEWDLANTKVTLKKGWNTIRLSNGEAKMPAIDCMTIKRFE